MSSGPKIRCLACGSVIQSASIHNFVFCSCGEVGIDGGDAYTRILGVNFEFVKEAANG